MAAYMIARIEVTDPADYAAYAGQTVALAGRWGGRFLVKGGAMEQLEGSGPVRHVVIEFPDAATARAFYASPDYRAILPIALRSSRRDLVLVEGV
jgi:uncharacterized protein (DUF1330 family)